MLSSEELLEACVSGDLETLKTAARNGEVDLSINDNEAVRIASREGHLPLVQWLILSSGQEVDATACRNNAVQLAACQGHLSVVKWLVKDSGQAVDVGDDDGWALRQAAYNGHFEVVKWLLLYSGAYFDISDANGAAVRWATEHGYPEIAQFLTSAQSLLKSGVNYNELYRYFQDTESLSQVFPNLLFTKFQGDGVLIKDLDSDTTLSVPRCQAELLRHRLLSAAYHLDLVLR